MKKQLTALLTFCCIITSLFSTAFAANQSFTINGVTVSASSGSSVWNCSTYASEVLQKIWHYKGVTTDFNTRFNMLNGKTADERKITQSHVRDYIQAAPLGSRIRITHYSSETIDNHDNNLYGHTLVLVAKNDKAGTFTTLEAGGGYAETNTYTYKQFAEKWSNFKCGYNYFFYIADLTSFGSNTSTSLPQIPKADYFSCNVKIACVNGQVVNLYNNAGDSNRVTYFNRGQVASSTYGAKLSDGSTWYKITADHNGSSRAFWLKFESNKMIVEDKAKPQTYTVTFNASSGTVSPTSKTYTAGDTYGTLPIPTYPGHVFKGWLTLPGYTYATPSATVPGTITLYARWEEEKPHTHQKGSESTCETEHPHRNYYICSICGEQFTDGTTNYVDSCKICNPKDSNNIYDNLVNLGQDAINAVNPPHTEHTKDNRIVSSAHPHYVFYTCSICGEVYTDNSKEAVSTCEQCWGSWSDWSTTKVSAGATRQVEERQVKISDGYNEYRYGRYIDSTGKNNCWCAKYLESLRYVSGKATLQYSAWSTTRYSANSTGWTCGFCNGNHIGVHHVGSDGRSWWAEYELPGGDYYWEESRTIDTKYETQYRYRDLISG